MNYIKVFVKYRFLLSQLVGRDFKAKYKRSLLGVLWSLLNPLMTMMVQYIVFSELFKWNIDNFSVYLISGSVMFNFFSESTNQALTSITGNAGLITKVYVPKYIFPVSKVISSCINFAFSLIALFVIVLINGLRPNIYYLMLPFGILCMIMFCMGMSFILASLMVYFRDTQFLYGVLLTLWTYLTPLFYPESIIPAKFMIIMKCNPMYHFIRYVRDIIMYANLPSLQAHIICLILAIVPLLIGIFVFKKAQKNFIINI